MILRDKDLGRIEVSTFKLPQYITDIEHPIYTFGGKVLLTYKSGDNSQEDYNNIALLSEDGTCRELYKGVIKQLRTANGMRLMPFRDNKRILLGDYVLECEPDLDNCRESSLIPVKYPETIMDNPLVTHHWSEIIVSPDNRCMAWTTLTTYGAINYIAELNRTENEYILKNVRIISSIDLIREDEQNPGYLQPGTLRGGEIKQFIRGGTALSLVGSTGSPLPDSVVQDLTGEQITAVTKKPGYEETTIFSPDENLGIVMSTRGSPQTNFAILGLLPRPYGYLIVQRMTMYVYFYAVSGVRNLRQGNIGPVLVDIKQSAADRDYQGIQLNDPQEEWVYLSPMSWHPAGKKAMWPEINRQSRQKRIRIVHLLDYEPGDSIKTQKTPEHIPYARDIDAVAVPEPSLEIKGEISGKYKGYVNYKMQNQGKYTETEYVNYSDDGKTYYNGYEKIEMTDDPGARYEAKLVATGAEKGEMNLRMAINLDQKNMVASISYQTAADGRPESQGYVSYNGKTLKIEEMYRG